MLKMALGSRFAWNNMRNAVIIFKYELFPNGYTLFKVLGIYDCKLLVHCILLVTLVFQVPVPERRPNLRHISVIFKPRLNHFIKTSFIKDWDKDRIRYSKFVIQFLVLAWKCGNHKISGVQRNRSLEEKLISDCPNRKSNPIFFYLMYQHPNQ